MFVALRLIEILFPWTRAPALGLVNESTIGSLLCTMMVRVGGLGSFTPEASIAVMETTYVPASLKATKPGFCTELDPGVPSGKIHE